NALVTEGGTASFNISLSTAAGVPVTVTATTADGTGANAATQPQDYTQKQETFTFSPGQTGKTFSVTTINDTIDEDDETFRALLSGASNANIVGGPGIGTITDDDSPPTIDILDPQPVSESAGTVLFTVRLSHASSHTITVHYETADGSAKDPADYL